MKTTTKLIAFSLLFAASVFAADPKESPALRLIRDYGANPGDFPMNPELSPGYGGNAVAFPQPVFDSYTITSSWGVGPRCPQMNFGRPDIYKGFAGTVFLNSAPTAFRLSNLPMSFGSRKGFAGSFLFDPLPNWHSFSREDN